MTGFLIDACRKTEAASRHPRMPERTVIERVLARMSRLSSGAQRNPEPWDQFSHRIAGLAPASLRPRDLKRLVEGMWAADHQWEVTKVLEACVGRGRRSFDRTIIHSYLTHFPIGHSASNDLIAACRLVASRYDWPWRDRGEHLQLWDPRQGPKKLARALVSAAEPIGVLRAAGLDGDLASGGFVKGALLAACEFVALQKRPHAEEAGATLIRLFGSLKATADLNGMLAFALLAPWVSDTCSDDHKRLVSALLVSRVGDPRLAGARWSALRADVEERLPEANADAVFGVIRRWLVQATFREFFSVVAKTTDRRDQWKERTDFWLGYLDAGVIADAWFAFGSMAERLARDRLRDETVGYARIEGVGADASHSALIFTIGDLRIGEWSHNGRTRFWRNADAKAPPLYQKIYYALVLRAMDGGVGFEALSHVGWWQSKFARHIYKETGIRHPKYGAGW